MKKKIWIIILCVLGYNNDFAQITSTNFTDSFNRSTLSPGGSPSLTYSVTTKNTNSGTTAGSSTTGIVSSTILTQSVTATSVLVTTYDTGVQYATMQLSGYNLPFTTILKNSIGSLTWTFNMQTSAAATGFARGSQEAAVVLAGSNGAVDISGNGYAVTFTTGSHIGVQLVRYSGGLQGTVTNIITPATSLLTNATDYCSVKVTYNPATESWALYLRDDGTSAFAYPSTGTLTQVGSATIDSTYAGTTMAVAGFYSSYAVNGGFLLGVSTNTARFDNFTSTGPCNPPSSVTASGASGTLCTGSALSLTGAATGASTYTWAGPGSFSSTSLNPVISAVTSANAGTYTFTAVTAAVCPKTATVAVAVNATATAVSGTPSVCAGSTATLSDALGSGAWSSSNMSIATVNSTTGSVYGIAAGTATISYIPAACIGTVVATFSVSTQPAAISGTTNICNGTATTLSDGTGSGTWSSTNTAVASISPGGTVTAISAGNTSVSYTLGSCAATAVFSVTAQPSAITGTASSCSGSSSALSDAVAGGTWSSSNTAIATISTSGSVTGISNGTSTITYIIGSCRATQTYTVNTSPSAIAGSTSVCATYSTALADTITGGSWSSGAPAIATVNATGSVTGLAAGSAIISYTLGSCLATKNFNVIAQPGAISGTMGACISSSNTLHDGISGGTWSSSNNAVATIGSSSGTVMAIGTGTTTITYNIGSCLAVQTYSVNALPAAITGTSSTCATYTTTLSDAVPGGTWSSGNPTVATVNAATGSVTGISSGSATMTYSLSNLCGTNTVTDNIAISNPGIWTGAASTSWNNSGNWVCGALPTASTDVVLAGGAYMPALASDSIASIKSLTITGAELTLNGSAVCNVSGSITNNGTVSGTGSLVANGTSVQMIEGTGNVYNMTLNNTSGATIGSGDTMKVNGVLTLTSGNLSTNGALVLASTATGTGSIGAITGGTISGNVILQQYIEAGRRAYRFMGHPFTSSIALNELTPYIDITGHGGAAEGFTPTITNAPSCYSYHTAYGNSSMGYDPGWIAFSNTGSSADSNMVHPYQGIRLFLRGAKSQGLDGASYTPSAVTLNMYGPINTNSVSITLHKSASSDYSLISNPYPSPVDIGSVIYAGKAAGQVAGSAFYVWNPYIGVSGAYQTIPISGSPYYISSCTSFEVRATSDGATLNFAESNKSGSVSAVLLKDAPEYIALQLLDTAYNQWDMMYLQFNDKATDSNDLQEDATKLLNPEVNFYSRSSDNTRLSIDARPYQGGHIIPLGLTTLYAEKYIIKASNINTNSQPLYLHDKLLNKYVKLESNTEYCFSVTTGKNTQGDDRFELSMGDSMANVVNAWAGITLSPNPATNEVTISYTGNGHDHTIITMSNVTGQEVYTMDAGLQTNGSMVANLSALPPGLYITSITCGTQKQTAKLIKQ